MKSFIILSTCTFILSSCATSEYYMADDVYVVKPSDLPIGESTADETTYAAFKQRQIGESNDRQLYGDVTRNRFDNSFNNFGNNYGFFLFSSQFPYGRQGLWMDYNYWNYQTMPGFYYGWNNGLWNGNSYGYNYPGYWHNGYNSYWCQHLGYGFGGYGNGYGYGGNLTYNQNVYNGPRGSFSGYSNPNGRSNSGKLKSGTYTSGNTAHSTSYNRTSNSKNMEKRPISSINQNTLYRTNNPNGSRTNSSASSSNSSRTYENADVSKRPRPTVYSNSTTRERTNTNENIGRPTIEKSGSDYNRNSGTMNSGSRGTSGSGNSRSGGTINSGRRP